MHKHYEMITAKSNNIDLVVLMNRTDRYWRKQAVDKDMISFSEYREYFLCHPKHTDECLHWLNGGKVYCDGHELEPFNGGRWDPEHVFMCDSVNITAEVKKRKKWILYRTDGCVVGPFDIKEDADKCGSGQVIGIEVL